MPITYNHFQVLASDMLMGTHDFASHQYKAVLSNTLPDYTVNEVAADIAEITPGNGYPAGGLPLDNMQIARIGAAAKVTVDNETVTANGGNIGPFQYMVIVNATSAGLRLVGAHDYGAPQTITDGLSFDLQFDQIDGILAHELL